MAFLRRATLDIKSVYATDNNGRFQWRDFVKQANENPSNDRTKFLPPEAYKYDTKNFLFLTARAISGMEKHGYNGNFDAFPWEEIKKALPTYPGVGFYIEHKEDSEEDAKGIVLDAVANDEDEYAVCLCAIDKNEYPEFCQQIIDGTYNQVSMSCLASTCICSKCGNVATSFDNLCEHMNPNNPITYMKGKKDENGDYVYEINKDICFTGLSAVEVPADKDAFVFDIKASKKKSDIKEEFHKYMAIKQAGKMKEFKMACEEQFKSMNNVDLLNKLQTSANTILSQVMGNEENASIITGPLQNILKQLMELQIGLTILDLQKLNNTSVKEETVQTQQEPLTMIEDDAESFGEQHQEKMNEVNLDKEIDSMIKQSGRTKLVTELCNSDTVELIDEDKNIYKVIPWNWSKKPYLIKVVDQEGKQTGYTQGSGYFVGDIDNLKMGEHSKINGNKAVFYKRIKTLPWEEADLDEKVNKEQVSLDKEIDSYLDGDNYSYTPFSSTANVKKQAGTWAIPDTKEKVQKLKDILKQPLPASEAKDKMYDLVGDDELFDEIDDYLETEPNEAMNSVIKHHLKRMQKCPLNRKSYNTREEYNEALEAQKLWDIILKDY